MGYKISDAVSVEPSSPEGSLEGHVLNLVMSDDGLRGAGIALEPRQRPRAAMRGEEKIHADSEEKCT